MRRNPAYEGTRWDDPIWNVCRVLLDIGRGRVLTLAEEEILGHLASAQNEAGAGLITFLEDHPEYLRWIADHLQYRVETENYLTEQLRSEEESVADLRELGEVEIRRYGTQSADHHQSSRAAVGAVDVITRMVCEEERIGVNVSPQSRAIVMTTDLIWASPRRLDGALPGLINPVGIWEIKEYWGVKGGGSKMSDANL